MGVGVGEGQSSTPESSHVPATPTVLTADYDGSARPYAMFTELSHMHNLIYYSSGSTAASSYGFEPNELLCWVDDSSKWNSVHDDPDPDDDTFNGHTQIGWVNTAEGKVLIILAFQDSSKKLTVRAAGNDLMLVRKIITEALDSAVKAKIQSYEVEVDFWVSGGARPESTSRDLHVPTWDEIRHNYSSEVVQEMTESWDRITNDQAGRILVWHGPPGTGKTWAIRAMMREMKKIFEYNYIVDPEVFFNKDPNYMLKVLMGGNYYGSAKDKKRLFILEDTGELLHADAGDRAGQGLSRLLNFTDGLIGQGMQLYVLITTNEDIKSLHEAVTRAGRCLSNIHFGPLPMRQANEWLAQNNASGLHVTEETKLSDLYAMLGDYERHDVDDRELEYVPGYV